MQKSKKPTPEVVKPVLNGSWHGRDAFKQGFKLMLNILLVSVLYLVLCLLLAFDSLVLRILVAIMLVSAAAVYLYATGMSAGQSDAAYGEIMYQRRAEGKTIPPRELERSFHPAKGFFAVLIGAAPYLIIAIVFACLTTLNTYSLGVLPTWLTRYTRQSGMGDALAYYQAREGITAVSILRIGVRAMTMPFVNVAVKLGSEATLWAERLSPLWILVAPLGYGFGYTRGIQVRTKINTGIAIGEKKKRRRARRERKAGANKSPERLI